MSAFSCRSRRRMRTHNAIMRPLAYALAICVLAPAGVPAQHVHGVVELGVVVEGGTVAVSLIAPLSDVVGFEHAPESDEQLEIIREAAAMLSNADAMFGLADSADCRISDTSVEGPGYVVQHLAEDHADSAVHDDHDSEQHEEINASYEWVCGNVSDLESLDLRFTESFASVETIEIQILTSAGAHVTTAEGRASSVSLSPR